MRSLQMIVALAAALMLVACGVDKIAAPSAMEPDQRYSNGVTIDIPDTVYADLSFGSPMVCPVQVQTFSIISPAALWGARTMNSTGSVTGKPGVILTPASVVRQEWGDNLPVFTWATDTMWTRSPNGWEVHDVATTIRWSSSGTPDQVVVTTHCKLPDMPRVQTAGHLTVLVPDTVQGAVSGGTLACTVPVEVFNADTASTYTWEDGAAVSTNGAGTRNQTLSYAFLTSHFGLIQSGTNNETLDVLGPAGSTATFGATITLNWPDDLADETVTVETTCKA